MNSTINVRPEARRALAGYCKLHEINKIEFVSKLILDSDEIKRLKEFVENGN